MAVTTQTIRVDLSTGKVIPTAYTHQNDTARTLVFDMYNGGLPYTMTGNTVKFAYKSPIVNGQYTVIAGSSMASGTVSGNTVSVTLPAAYTAISGVGLLTMIITPTSGTIRPVNIKFIVQKSADGDDTIAGASDFPATLGEIVGEIAEDWLEENISIQIDDTLSVSGKAADAKVTGDEISELDGKVTDLKSDLESLEDGELSNEAKTVLLRCFQNVAWINDQGQTYYDALYAALYPPKTLVSISASFDQGSAVIYDTDSLDSLKQYLTVTATYDDTSTGVVTNYTLSGTLTAGTSTITVSYSGMTTTFNAIVTGVLPSEYQRVEYIANPSDAYITTTIPIALGNTVHVQSLLSAKPSATANVCGGTAYNQNRAYVSYSTSNNYVGAWVGNTNCFPLISDLYASVLESWTTVPSGSVYFKGKNDSAENEKTVSGTTTALTALELFRAGSAGGAFTGRVYFLEVLNGGTATARLYPCYRKADNVVGMYDTVNEKFYTSANTTAFTKGANV